ncbi:MAG: homeobox domain-containing protein, partial [Methanobacteriota archaeon]
PTDPQKEALAAQCNISVRQVSVWFTNARKRIWLPLRQKQARMRNKRAKAGDATSMGASHEGHATAFEDAEQGDEHGHDLEHDGSEGACGAGDAGGETAGAGTSAGSNANGIAHARGNVGAVGAASVASSVRGGGGGGSVAREASAGTPASTVSDSTTQNGVRKSASPDDREGALHLAALASAAVSAARADDLLYLPGEADSFSAARSSRKTESSRQSATSHAMHSNTPTTSSDMSNTASSTPQSGSDPYTTEANNLRAAHHDRSRSMAGSRGGWTGSNYTGVSPLHTASPRVEALLMGAAAVDAATGGAAAARSGFPDLLSGSLSAHMHPRVQALSPSMAPPHFPYALSVITPQYVLGLLEGVDEQSAAVRLAAVAGAVAINRKELEAEAAHLRALEAVIAEAHQRLLSARLKNMRSGAQ